MSSVTGGNPSGPNKAARADPLGQPPGGQVLFASVSRSEKRDQRTLPKQAPGKQPIPSPAPRGWRSYLEPSWEEANPRPQHSSPVRLPGCPTCSQSPDSVGHASRGAERDVSKAEVCVLVVLFGWKQRPFWQDWGLSGTGRGVRYSQPRAKPSDSCVPRLPEATHV